MNAVEIEQAICKLCETPFDQEEFPYQFLEAFGEKPPTIKRLRAKKNSTNKSDLPGAVLLRSNIHIIASTPRKVGKDLKRLVDSPETSKHKAKFAIATDGKFVEAENLFEGETLACTFKELPDHFGFFLALAGIATVKQIRDNAFDIKATGRMNRLYVELQKNNPDWDTEERREELNHFFARLIFCFFAEDTGIFPGDDLFTGTVQQMSDSDGSNTHEIINEIFRAMNIPREERDDAGLPPHAKSMPYVNGGLFEGNTECPTFTKIARSYLIHIGGLDWTKINPDIFGSMIQAVAEDEERGELGMHYTSVPNILKVLNPLFLDELRQQLEDAADNKRKLLNLRNRIARIRVFDPACGSGNFLVVAYKEMRQIEAEINRRRGESDRASEIPLTNFRGIEIRSFAAEVARLALVIAQFQCDLEYRGPQLALSETLPLSKSNWITCGNALRLNWMDLCPPTTTGTRISADDLFETPLDQPEIDFENEGGETFICGNPPYAGSSLQSQSQKAELQYLFDSVLKSWKNLDYIAGWFLKAAKYGQAANSNFAFVSTNSICQGQQASLLWPLMFERGIRIHFAHTSFKWSNLAASNAGVTVIIVGGTTRSRSSATLFSHEDSELPAKRIVPHINAYLTPGADVIVKPRSKTPDARGSMVKGNMPSDGGYLVLSANHRAELVREDPRASEFIYGYFGSRDLIRGEVRHCLWISDEDVDRATAILEIKTRLDGVSQFRATAKAPTTRPYAAYPHRFRQIQGVARSHSIVVPRHSSESREYLPAGVLSAGSIVSDAALVIYDAPLWNVSLITSRLHLVWIDAVCGKLKTDYRYSNTLGWNTFPIPSISQSNQDDLEKCAEGILLARESYWPATIADMYDPKRMDSEFPRVREAHEHNDEVLERIYIGRRFKNDTERLEKLFEMYAAATKEEAPA